MYNDGPLYVVGWFKDQSTAIGLPFNSTFDRINIIWFRTPQSNSNHAMLILHLDNLALIYYFDDAVGVPSDCFIYGY